MLSINVANWTVRVRIRSAALACDFLKCWKYSTSKAHAGSLFRGALHKKSRKPSSLCDLCVLCVSVVDEFRAKTHHRDTENTEVAQRNPYVGTFCAKPFRGYWV